MKKYILLLGSIFAIMSFDVQAQQNPNQLGHGFVLTKTKTMDEVVGSPYLEDSFKKGRIIFEEKDPLDVFLRYNVLDEEMEIKLDKETQEVFKVPSTNKTQYVIGGDLFLRDGINYEGERIEGFFKEMYDGSKIRLLVKPTAHLSEAVAAKTSYESDKPARISVGEDYYLVFKEEGKVENVRLKRRDLRKAFDTKEVKEYLKDNKIRTVEDLVALVRYYDKQDS